MQRFSILVVLVTFYSVLLIVIQSSEAFVRRDVSDVIADGSSTVTVIKLEYAPGATTVTYATAPAAFCGIVHEASSSNTNHCRQRRQLWLELPLMIATDPDFGAFIKRKLFPATTTTFSYDNLSLT